MNTIKKEKKVKVKAELHPRNKHKERYNFEELIKSSPELKQYIILNKYNSDSIDFSNPESVKALNKALLLHFYAIESWDIPEGFLCPPIPGRADYIHLVADLLSGGDESKIPKGNTVTCLDIGTGANLVYPIIGVSEYDWNFIGSDIDPISIDWAKEILAKNKNLASKIEIKLQKNADAIFKGVLSKSQKINISICNPPFHSSLKKSQAGTLRKLSNLKGEKVVNVSKNFGGTNNELWCVGGEKRFISNMINESLEYKTNCEWFTTIVSDRDSLKSLYKTLEKVNPTAIKTIPMGQGNKTSRILAWTFKKA